ncbi:MAG: prefoldin subunit alpha [Candidatus Altiarchaeales archaeon HGW-Altiarchaeales-3]|nr:MAG: prefoldin subunit alpha [Candidatus Altiarchaeales archaeon HGW-Altiarchaeales-3]
MDVKKQEELQKIMYQAEVYKQQIDAINNQIMMVDGTIKSMESTIEALTSLKTTDAGCEIMLPLGSNAYARAKLSDNEKVVVGVGAGIMLEKTIPDAIKLFDKNIENLHSALAEMQKKSAEIEQRLIRLNDIGEQRVKEMQEQNKII